MRKVLLISNRVMHYRVSLYNSFTRKFREHGWELLVRSNELESQNRHEMAFDFKEVPFRLFSYTKEIKEIAPDAVILFLHLKDKVIWPLVHWLKLNRIPVAFWTKGMNLEKPSGKFRYQLFNYMHSMCDGLILYSRQELKFIQERNRSKVFIANNTLNFEDVPEIHDSVEDIKKEFDLPFEKFVLSVGRMGEGGQRKKVDHLIDVFRDVELPGAGLVIVGSGVTEDLLARTNRDNTKYLGEIHDPRDIQISKLFKAADVFSIPGQLGLGLNQAMFWGLPVVTEAGFQPPEIQYLVDGRSGFIVPDNDRVALKQKIVYLLENDAVRAEFGRNAREDVLKNGSTEGMFRGFLECVESLASRRRQ